MSEFAKKILSGQATNSQDWVQCLKDLHRADPGMTPPLCAHYFTASKQSTYEILAQTVTGPAHLIVDLACGNGALIPFLLPRIHPEGRILGLDMSEDELAMAKKNIQESRVSFHQGMADLIPCADASADFILCHMALMLMTPVEPVIQEVARVLKPGGTFSAIVGGPLSAQGFFHDIRQVTGEFFQSIFPQLRNVVTGDPRSSTEAGIKELFHANLGFENEVAIKDFDLLIDLTPEMTWKIIEGTYFARLLSPSQSAELERRLRRLGEGKESSEPYFGLPIRQLTVRKRT